MPDNAPSYASNRTEVLPKRTFFADWRAVDGLMAAFLALLSIIELFFAGRIEHWYYLVAINVAIIAGIAFFARVAAHTRSRLIRGTFDWYPAPMILLVFKEVYLIIQGAAIPDMDHLLIAIDRAIFGVDPTVWLWQFSHPVLNEILQLAYAGYFIIMILTGAEVYRRNEMQRFEYYLFLLSYGFLLSYIGYMFVPGIGPRFTLHDFASLDNELPGLFFSVPIRNFLNMGESIPLGAPDAWRHAQRDVFPSGHTELTLLSLYLAFRWRLRSRYVLLVMGILLVISTVFLRYHYVIDVIAGALFAWFCIATAPALVRWWEGKFNGRWKTEDGR